MLAFLVVTTIIIIGVGILEPVDLIINGAPPQVGVVELVRLWLGLGAPALRFGVWVRVSPFNS